MVDALLYFYPLVFLDVVDLLKRMRQTNGHRSFVRSVVRSVVRSFSSCSAFLDSLACFCCWKKRPKEGESSSSSIAWTVGGGGSRGGGSGGSGGSDGSV